MIFILLSIAISQEYRLTNNHLSYTWEVNNDNAISTKRIENYDTKNPTSIIPNQGSEEFLISIRNEELNTIQSPSSAELNNYLIKSSNLQVMNMHSSKSKIIFTYKPYTFRDVTWDIKEIVELEENKHYLHKYIQIKSSNPDVSIDYIDFDSFIFKDSDLKYSWSTTFTEDTLKNLGQPIYINSLFFGCQFPLTESKIESNQKLSRIRYYSGKKFSDLPLNEDKYYETWKTVIGVAHNNDISIVQKDFFSYISDISVPSQLRRQYNDLNSAKPIQSFEDIEKGFSQFGLPPPDSFVINDKKTKNKAPSSKYTKKIQSNLGVFFDSPSNVFGSHKYIEKVKNNLVNYIHKYKVNYFKLNEFKEIPSNDIYKLTDLWECIISAYSEIKKAAKDEKIKNFWISSPMFSNLSPFHLQWSNSIMTEIPIKKQISSSGEFLTLFDQHIWSLNQIQFPSKNIQINDNLKFKKLIFNDDEDFRQFLYGNAMSGSSIYDISFCNQKVDKKDDRWLVNSDFQLWADKNFKALQNSQLFGGQPIKGEVYGYSAWNGNDGIIALRNPGQKEAKFSIKLDSKIGINEKLATVYRSTILHHKTTNLDEIQNNAVYHYGDTLEVTLEKDEYRIYEFHDFIDHSSPTVEVIKTTKDNEVLIRFNKKIDLSESEFKINGLQIKDKKLLGDLRTVKLTTTTPMKNYSVYSLSIQNIKDIFGNSLNTKVEYQHFSNNKIVSIHGEISGNDNAIQLTDVSTDSFTINLHVKNFKGIKKGSSLLHSEDKTISIEIDEKRHIKFTVDSVSVVSNQPVKDDVDYQFSFVRERNSMLKIYKNTKLDNTNYATNKNKMIKMKKIKLNKNPVIYSSISIDNYALPYNEIPYEISLKNKYIEQVFVIQNRKVQTKQILNHRSDESITFTPSSGSEEFSFSIPNAEKQNENLIIKSSDCEVEWEYRKNSANEETIAFYYYYKYRTVKFNITKRYELLPENYYIEKQLEFKCSKKNQIINYIDLDSYLLSESDEQKSWTHPTVEQDLYSMLSPFIINLGQPIYINSFFTGCLFPLTDNAIENHISRIRYHTGKTFKQLLQDNLIEVNENDVDDNTYYCWKTIFGAATSNRIEVVRKDLFDYLSSISVPTTFRKQYNSWYDWMLNIDESNILKSFKEIESSFNQYGVPPLDSYVVDDGWNNYNSLKYNVYNEDSSGNTYNNEGFWCFNSKFPDGLTKPSDFTHRISSHFGVWLGPRGGYVTPGQFGRMIEDSKNGFYNAQSNDIDVGSTKYIKKLDSFLSNWIRSYKVNYLKLDGFATKACTNESHDHMIGGPEGVYYFVDLWEKYIEVFEHLRSVADESEVHDLWISITSYVNPSPFHLQWSNSVWIQVSDDIGFVNTSMKDNMANLMLTYRDSCYYDFYDHHQFQFPSKCLYNHDPIYGKANTPLKDSLNNDYFRTYLYFCAMRGNAFTEMYYTYSMLDEGDKWYINSEVLKWTESHFDVIQNSQRFGGDPKTASVYGYSAWNEKSGIIAIRNPSGRSTNYTLKIDSKIGVPEKVGTTYRKSVLTHNTAQDLEEGKATKYNDEIVFTLKPREVRVIEFTNEKDNEKPKVELCKALSKQRVLVRFNKKIIKNVENYEIDGLEILNVSIKADRRSIILRTSPMEKNKEYKLEVEKVVDQFGNKLDEEEIKFTYFAHGLLTSSKSLKSIGIRNSETVLFDDEISTDSFSIQLDINHIENSQNTVLLQDDRNSIKVELFDRKMKFTVGKLSVTSIENIPTDNCKVTLVRERNKMIKIYINNEISNSAYSSDGDEIIKINKLTLMQSPITYNGVHTSNYAFKYDEDANTDENDQENNEVDIDDDIRDYIDDEEDQTSPELPTTPPSSSSSSSSGSSTSSSSDDVESANPSFTYSSGSSSDGSGNESKKKSAFERLMPYLIVMFVLIGVAIIALVILLMMIAKKKKASNKESITYPLVSEDL